MGNVREEKYRYTEDGILLVRKQETVRVGVYDTGPIGRGLWYRCSGDDPDCHYRRMVLFGWFGWHRFRERSFGAGMFYLLTCGCFGVFYLYDLVSMLTGSYSYREISYREGEAGLERHKSKIYYGPMEDRKKGLLLLPLAAVILAAAVLFLYQPVGRMMLQWSMDALADKVTEENLSGLLRLVQ